MNKNNVNISKKILQSMTVAVCAWTILLGLVAPGMAAETEVPAIQESVLLETTAKTTAEAVTEEDNSGTTQYLLATLRGEIAEYMEIYQISPEMPDSALANAYFALDSAEAKAAWDTAHTLMEKAAELSDEDTAALMADINTKLCLRFYGIMAQINNPAMAAEYTTISGLTITDTGSNAEVSTNSLKASVAGSKDSCGNDKEASRTITLKNSSGSVRTLSFDWKVDGNASSFAITKSNGSTITATSGTGFSDDLAANASVTITFKAKGSGNTATLSLSSVKLMAAASASNISFQYDTKYGSVQQGSTSVNNGETVSIKSHTEFTAVPANGAKFVAWLDNFNKVLGVNSTLLVEASGDQSIYALFVHPTKSTAWFDPGNGYLYSDWNTAFTSGSVVAIACDGLLPAGPHTVASGKTLLIPYNDANTVITTNMENYDILPSAAGTQTLYRQLIMPSGTSITVQNGGSLNVGSRASRQMTGQVGAYGAIKMDAGSNITIESGATLYAWGYLFHGDTDSGTVTVESGGMVYEMLMNMDYLGNADNTNTVFNKGVFPLRAFTVRNVEVPMTLEYGAIEKGFFHFYGNNILVGENPGYMSLIGDDSSYTFQLESGTEITKSYIGGRQKFSVDGSIILNSIAIKVKSTDITSSKTSGFPIPSGYDFEILSGTFKMGENVVCYEGSTMKIAKGAVVDTNGKNIYILDADDDPGALWVEGESKNLLNASVDVHGTSYGRVDVDPVWEVNGTIKVSGGLYTSINKAAITSTGNGQIIFDDASVDNITVNIRYGRGYINEGNAGYKALDITSAYLLNSDNGYTSTEESATATYTYLNGFWHKGTSCSGGTASCKQKAVCTTCGQEYGELLPHIDGTPVVDYIMLPTYKTEGSYTSTVSCTNCRKEIRTETLTAPKVVQQAAIAASADSEIILDVKFWLPEEFENDTKATVTVTFRDEEPRTYAVNELAVDNNRYVITQSIASGEMTCPVDITFRSGDGTVVKARSGNAISDSLSKSVVDYAKLVLENGTDLQKTLITNLLTYGGYSQVKFGVDADNPAYKLLEEKGIDVPDVANTAISVTESDTVTAVSTITGSITGLTVSEKNQAYLDSAIYFRLYFTLTEGSTEDYSVSYQLPVGNRDTVAVPLEIKAETNPDTRNIRYYVDIPDIPSGYLDYPYKVTFSKGSETLTVQTSVLAYLKRLVDNGAATTDEKNLAKAMYLYNQAANTFFNK